MDGRWSSHCEETPQDANRLSGAIFGQLSPAASSPYYQLQQAVLVSSIPPQAVLWDSSTGQRAMPTHAKASKVTKPGATGRRGSCQSSLPGNVRDHLEQFVQQGNTNVNSDAAQMCHLAATGSNSNDQPDSSVNLTNTEASVHGSTSIPCLHSSMQDVFDTNGGAFRLNDEHQLSGNTASPSHSSLENNEVLVKNDIPIPVQTAADVVLKKYQTVKIDSTLCKKLAGEPALREPAQRRRDQKLNIERRSNVEALLAHVTGEVASRPCKNCHKGHGPWTQCIVYDGQMCGSCTNCWFNASGSRFLLGLSVHEVNLTDSSQTENNNPQHSLYTSTVQTPSAQPVAMLNYQQQPMLAQNSPATLASFHPEAAQWNMADPTRHLIANVMRETTMQSQKDRFLARIEAAARELGMRIAEFDEFLQTPEGLAEQQMEQRYHLAQHNQIGDVSMDEDSPAAHMS
ncbi:hypothetical protein E4U21_003912 [Claviceps maximensis]|nr:hypothetical protein E4U21_003912 [Claviceps maximensis]